MKLQFFIRALVFSVLSSSSLVVLAAYPDRPVTIIIGFPPGTGTDTVTRIMADRLSQRMGQQFLVENKVGVAGSIGAGASINSISATVFTRSLKPEYFSIGKRCPAGSGNTK